MLSDVFFPLLYIIFEILNIKGALLDGRQATVIAIIVSTVRGKEEFWGYTYVEEMLKYEYCYIVLAIEKLWSKPD